MWVFICENYFLSYTRFKEVNFLESQSTHFDFYCHILFSNATSFMFFFKFFTTYKITYLFLYVFLFFFWFKTIFIILGHFYKVYSIFFTIHFKHSDFIEKFDLNSNPSSLFERSSIGHFLVSSLVYFLISNVTTTLPKSS